MFDDEFGSESDDAIADVVSGASLASGTMVPWVMGERVWVGE